MHLPAPFVVDLFVAIGAEPICALFADSSSNFTFAFKALSELVRFNYLCLGYCLWLLFLLLKETFLSSYALLCLFLFTKKFVWASAVISEVPLAFEDCHVSDYHLLPLLLLSLHFFHHLLSLVSPEVFLYHNRRLFDSLNSYSSVDFLDPLYCFVVSEFK